MVMGPLTIILTFLVFVAALATGAVWLTGADIAVEWWRFLAGAGTVGVCLSGVVWFLEIN
jgi:hypothetical protein